jgi:hypothetical protein
MQPKVKKNNFRVPSMLLASPLSGKVLDYTMPAWGDRGMDHWDGQVSLAGEIVTRDARDTRIAPNSVQLFHEKLVMIEDWCW